MGAKRPLLHMHYNLDGLSPGIKVAILPSGESGGRAFRGDPPLPCVASGKALPLPDGQIWSGQLSTSLWYGNRRVGDRSPHLKYVYSTRLFQLVYNIVPAQSNGSPK